MPANPDFSKKILVSITGMRDIDWMSKLEEIEERKISRIALFLEIFEKPQRKRIYRALLHSCVKSIPLVHIRNDMRKQELVFLQENFGSSYFTIHEDSFDFLDNWKGFHKRLYLEMNADDHAPHNVDPNKIGGFCIDLSHFKVAEKKQAKEYEYVMQWRNKRHLFACNHLNGYSYEKNTDLHRVCGLKDFNYLKTLPRFLFGRVIGLEVENSIAEQLEFKRYLVGILNELFNNKKIS